MKNKQYVIDISMISKNDFSFMIFENSLYAFLQAFKGLKKCKIFLDGKEFMKDKKEK